MGAIDFILQNSGWIGNSEDFELVSHCSLLALDLRVIAFPLGQVLT
jgi:hypothetical protein